MPPCKAICVGKIYTHVYIHTYIYVHTHKNTSINIYIHTYIYIVVTWCVKSTKATIYFWTNVSVIAPSSGLIRMRAGGIFILNFVYYMLPRWLYVLAVWTSNTFGGCIQDGCQIVMRGLVWRFWRFWRLATSNPDETEIDLCFIEQITYLYHDMQVITMLQLSKLRRAIYTLTYIHILCYAIMFVLFKIDVASPAWAAMIRLPRSLRLCLPHVFDVILIWDRDASFLPYFKLLLMRVRHSSPVGWILSAR